MKKIFLTILLSLYSLYAEKNIVFIDASFKQALVRSVINVNGDGEISETEAQNADSLHLEVWSSDNVITSYSDLKLFPNLTYLQILETYYGALPKSIDFAGVSKLKRLYVYSNNANITYENLEALYDLEFLVLTAGNSRIDLQDLTKLGEIRLNMLGTTPKLPPNVNKLTIYNASVKKLDLSGSMAYNSNLSITNSSTLESLVLPIAKLSELNLSDLAELTSLDLSQCMIPINRVTISDCRKLESLAFSYSRQIDDLTLEDTGMEVLDLENQSLLRRLILIGNNIQSLKLPKPNELRYFSCDGASLSKIDLRDNRGLAGLSIHSMQLDSIYLPLNSRLTYFDINNDYWNKPGPIYIGNFEKQIYLSSLNMAGTYINNTIDVSTMNDLEYLSYQNTSGGDRLRFVCVKDLLQAKRLYMAGLDQYIHFVTCHNVATSDCKAHVTPTSICDDFKDASPGDSRNDEYAIPIDKPAWLYGIPSPYKKASLGGFWVLPAQSSDFVSSKTRNDNGSLTFNITKTSDLVQPMMLTFGNYAEGNQEAKCTVDLSNNAVVSFDVNTIKNPYSNLIVELEDINGNTLRLDKSVLSNDNDYHHAHYQIGIPMQLYDLRDNKINGIQLDQEVGEYGIKAKYMPDFAPGPNKVHKFYYDFKNAICGGFGKVPDFNCCNDSVVVLVPKPELQFDYKHVALVKLMRTTFSQDNLGTDSTNFSFTISNFRMGDGGYTVGFASEEFHEVDNEVFKVYDMMGTFVAEGLWEDLALNPRQLYILKSIHRTIKTVILE